MFDSNRAGFVFLTIYCLYTLVGCKSFNEADSREGEMGRAAQGSGDDVSQPGHDKVAEDLSTGSPRRLLVFRLAKGGVELIKSTPLGPASHRGRAFHRAGRFPRGRDGRYEVKDCSGRTLSKGTFRIPRRVHALFDNVEGLAGPGSAPLPPGESVLWSRVETPRSSCWVDFWDRDTYLGRVVL